MLVAISSSLCLETPSSRAVSLTDLPAPSSRIALSNKDRDRLEGGLDPTGKAIGVVDQRYHKASMCINFE